MVTKHEYAWNYCNLKQCQKKIVDEHEWEIETLLLDGWQMLTKYKKRFFMIKKFGC
jgi:hypothetical protein